MLLRAFHDPNLGKTVRYFSMLIAILVMLTLGGCCSCHNAQGFENFKPISINGNDGLRYELLAPYSIQQRIDSESAEDIHEQALLRGIRLLFPNDTKLDAHLQTFSETLHKRSTSYVDFLKSVKSDVAKSNGELFIYQSFRNGVIYDTSPTSQPYEDQGWLIFAGGKIYKVIQWASYPHPK
jgi:hypothetical protein